MCCIYLLVGYLAVAVSCSGIAQNIINSAQKDWPALGKILDEVHSGKVSPETAALKNKRLLVGSTRDLSNKTRFFDDIQRSRNWKSERGTQLSCCFPVPFDSLVTERPPSGHRERRHPKRFTHTLKQRDYLLGKDHSLQ